VYVRADAQGRARYEYQAKRNGKTTRLTLDASTPTDAIQEANRLRVVSAEAGLADGSLRLAALVERFFAEARSGEYQPPRGKLATSTVDLYEQRLRLHVLPALGHSTRVRAVDGARLRLMIDKLRFSGLSGSTIRSTVVALKAVFRFAVRRGLIASNPVLALDADLPSAARTSEPVYLTREEVGGLLDELSDEFRPVATTCVYLGLRISEALGLRWGDIDWAAKTVAIERQLGRDGATLVPLKTRSSQATLSLPAPLVEELRAHRDRQGRCGFDRIGADELVFQTRSGRSPGRRNALRAVQVAAARLDLRNADGELLGLHDLRHSTAGLLREAGLPDEEIAVALRHANARTTTVMYGGRDEGAKQAIRAKAAGALG
jgi:integrase